MEKIDYVAQGKANRKKGADFEVKVRKWLERTWDVVKFQNNVDLDTKKFIKAKQKFIRGRGMGLGSGFPDFMVFDPKKEIFFVECKTNGTLSKIEKQKMQVITDMGYKCWTAYLDGKEIKFRKFVEYPKRPVISRKAS